MKRLGVKSDGGPVSVEGVPPRLWKDLLGYHKIGEGMMNPVTGSSLDGIDTFSRFDNASFP
jgi:hypothetical protein